MAESKAGKAKTPAIELEVGERTVRISNPDRVYFPARGETKLDLVRYYLSVGDGIVRALRERPCMLHRFPEGVSGEKVHQKRLPHGAPPWMETVRVKFPRYNRTADELCVTEVFASGTAAVITPIGRLAWPEGDLTIGDHSVDYGVGPVTKSIRSTLLDLQYGRIPDHRGWLTRLA